MLKGFYNKSLRLTAVEGFKAKFKGIKPKKVKVAVKATDNSKSVAQVKKPKAKKIVKKSFLAADAGELPVLKRKQAVAPQDIENNDIEEVE